MFVGVDNFALARRQIQASIGYGAPLGFILSHAVFSSAPLLKIQECSKIELVAYYGRVFAVNAAQ